MLLGRFLISCTMNSLHMLVPTVSSPAASIYLRRTFALIVLATVSVLLGGCGTTGPEEETAINEDIVLLKEARAEGETLESNLIMGAWTPESIFAAIPLWEITVDSDLKIGEESLLFELGSHPGRPVTFIQTSRSESSLLYVRSIFGGASLGTLYEFNGDGEERVLRDSSYAVSSAVYHPEDANIVFYYSYGSDPAFGNADQERTPGYYRLDTTTGTDTLLVEHRSPLGPDEMINGFDIHPDGTTLLIPDVRSSISTPRRPRIVEYDLTTETPDTLALDYDSFINRGLWLRYSPDGSQILYSNFPFNAYSDTAAPESEVGIFDRATGAKRELDVNTDPRGESVQIAPTWSPNGQHILYGSAPLTLPRGAVGPYSLYVLQDVN